MDKPRLIDANELIMSIANWQQSLSTPDVDMVDKMIWDTLESVIMTIENTPTAYDIDKVVKQLEESTVVLYDPCEEDAYVVIHEPEAIEIVKKGGDADA